jgi:hypothetical protein
MPHVTMSGATAPTVHPETGPSGGLHLRISNVSWVIHWSPEEARVLAEQLAAALGSRLVPVEASLDPACVCRHPRTRHGLGGDCLECPCRRWTAPADHARDGGPFADPSTYALELYPLPPGRAPAPQLPEVDEHRCDPTCPDWRGEWQASEQAKTSVENASLSRQDAPRIDDPPEIDSLHALGGKEAAFSTVRDCMPDGIAVPAAQRFTPCVDQTGCRHLGSIHDAVTGVCLVGSCPSHTFTADPGYVLQHKETGHE